MNATDSIRKEIVQAIGEHPAEAECALVALTKCVATMGVYRKGFSIEYEFRDQSLALTVGGWLKDAYGASVEFEFSAQTPRTYLVRVASDCANATLERMGLTHYDRDGNLIMTRGLPALETVRNRETARAYVAGFFLGCGSCYAPDDVETRGGYHLEFTVAEEILARQLAGVLERLAIPLHMTPRGDNWAVYSKSGEQIADLLALLQAMNSVMELNDLMIRRQINNDINRRSNVYIANLDKISLANTRYITAAQTVLDAHATQDEKLLSVATERVRDREESMSALAARLQMSKSSLSRALNKLVKLAGIEEQGE